MPYYGVRVVLTSRLISLNVEACHVPADVSEVVINSPSLAVILRGFGELAGTVRAEIEESQTAHELRAVRRM
jgi:hypothetical protein